VEVPFLGQILGANINLLITLKIGRRWNTRLPTSNKDCTCYSVKRKMGIQNILKREHEIVDYVFSQLGSISNIKFWQANIRIG
jgi:hypothetical protein